MKSFKQVLLCTLIVMALSATAHARYFKNGNSIEMDYWATDYNKSMSGVSESSDPDFFPCMNVIYRVHSNFSIDARYHNSTADAVSPSSAGKEDKVYRYLVGLVYDFASTGQVELAYQEFKNRQSNWSGSYTSYKINGLRLSLLKHHRWAGTPWAFGAEAGVGISNDARVSPTGADEPGTGGDTRDFDVWFSYDLPEMPLKLRAGYRYLWIHTDAINEIGFSSAKHIIRGPHFGLTYIY